MKRAMRMFTKAAGIALIGLLGATLGVSMSRTLSENADLGSDITVGVIAGLIAGTIVSIYEFAAHNVMRRNRNRDTRVAVGWYITNLKKVVESEESYRGKLNQFASGVRAILSLVETDPGNMDVVEKSAIINYIMPYSFYNERSLQLLSLGGNLMPGEEYYSRFFAELTSLIRNPDTKNLHFYHLSGLENLYAAEQDLNQE